MRPWIRGWKNGVEKGRKSGIEEDWKDGTSTFFIAGYVTAFFRIIFSLNQDFLAICFGRRRLPSMRKCWWIQIHSKKVHHVSS